MKNISSIIILFAALLSVGCSKSETATTFQGGEVTFSSSLAFDAEFSTTRSSSEMTFDMGWGGVVGVKQIDGGTVSELWKMDPTGSHPVKFSVADDGLLEIRQYNGTAYVANSSLYDGYHGKILNVGGGEYRFISFGVSGSATSTGELNDAFNGSRYTIDASGKASTAKDYILASSDAKIDANMTEPAPTPVEMNYHHVMGKIRFEFYYNGQRVSDATLKNIDCLKIVQNATVNVASGEIGMADESKFLNSAELSTDYFALPTVQDNKTVYELKNAVIEPVIITYNGEEFFVPFDMKTLKMKIEQNCRTVVKMSTVETKSIGSTEPKVELVKERF